AGSMTSPAAFTATRAATIKPSGSVIAALPIPAFIACSNPPDLPIVAPAPAPTLPSVTGAFVAAFAAAYPQSAVGRIFGSPTGKSNSDAAGTVGTWAPPNGKPIPF